MTAGYLDGIQLDGSLFKYRSRNPYVLDFQHFFNGLGYKLKANGVFDKMTLYVVKDFQRHCRLRVDGIIGNKTKSKMFYYDGDNEYCPEVFEPIKPGIIYSEGKIEDLLRYNLKGLGEAFYLASMANEVDVLHVIAHAILESNWGRSFIARMKNNLFGFRAYDSSPYASAGRFKDFNDCIITWVKWWNRNYLVEGGKYFNGCNEQGVNVRYATSPIAGVNKSFIVRSLRNAVSK